MVAAIHIRCAHLESVSCRGTVFADPVPSHGANVQLYAQQSIFLKVFIMLILFPDSPVIFGGITIFGILSWLFTPEDKWLPAARLGKVHEFVED